MSDNRRAVDSRLVRRSPARRPDRASQYHRRRHTRNPGHAHPPVGHRCAGVQSALPGDDSVSYRCSTKSANALDALIAKRPVSCVPVSLDQYGRTVATARWLGSILPTGLSAMALRWIGRAIPTAGTDAQRDAEHAVRGIWAGSYFAPWLYRARIRAGGTPRSCSDDANAHP
jgi:endonuclease YncB( thermonuclease family)